MIYILLLLDFSFLFLVIVIVIVIVRGGGMVCFFRVRYPWVDAS